MRNFYTPLICVVFIMVIISNSMFAGDHRSNASAEVVVDVIPAVSYSITGNTLLANTTPLQMLHTMETPVVATIEGLTVLIEVDSESYIPGRIEDLSTPHQIGAEKGESAGRTVILLSYISI